VAACGATVVCAAAAVAVAATAGAGAHLVSDAITDDNQRDLSVGRAFYESFVGSTVGAACVLTLGGGCALSSILQPTIPRLVFGASAIIVGMYLKWAQ
jgi:hypothetical protein